MASETKIEWADSTLNPWIGCTRVSPACDHCYAAVSTPVRTKGIQWGASQPRQRTSPSNWKLPERWNREPFSECSCGWRGERKNAPMLTKPEHADHEVEEFRACPACSRADLRPARRRVFCASLADWLDNQVPIEWLADLLQLIHDTPNLDWLLLTKRIGNFWDRITAAGRVLQRDRWEMGAGSSGDWLEGWVQQQPPNNVWLGATVVNQAEADRDVPKLLQVPARVRFLSIEPMLGPIDLERIAWAGADKQTRTNALRPGWVHDSGTTMDWPGLDWIICGGESGPRARPMHPDWVRSLRDQCAAAGVPFLLKQWGEWAPEILGYPVLDSHFWPICKDKAQSVSYRIGKKAAGNMLDGRQHLEWPA